MDFEDLKHSNKIIGKDTELKNITSIVRHNLKIEKNYPDNLLIGRKKVEIRYNDRDYQLGDILVFTDGDNTYEFIITHVHSGLGMADGYVALSVERLEFG